MKYFSTYLTALGCFLLAGCLDYNQELTVSKDGVATYLAEMTIDSGAIALMADNEDFDIDTFCDDTAVFEASEQIVVTDNQFYRSGDFVCSHKAEGQIDAFITQLRDYELKHDEEALFELVKLEGGNVRLTFVLDGQAFAEAMNGDGEEETSATRDAIIAAMFDGRALRWRVSAPEVLDSSAPISSDTTSTDWEFPFTELMANTDSQAYFSVTFKPSESVFDRVRNLFD